MDYEFLSKIGLVTGLFFFVNYFYKNTNWHSSTKNEKRNLQYYIKYLLILFFGLALFCSSLILSMIFLKEAINYFEKVSYWEQIGLSLGLIVLYFYCLILKDEKKIKADKQQLTIEKQQHEILQLEKKIKTLEIKK
ncbi:hypothetical protein [Flavobacterium sp. 3-210]